MMLSKKLLIAILLPTILLALTGCGQCISLISYVDKTRAFDYHVGTEVKNPITVGSEKHRKLLDWFSKNDCEWKSSSASYLSSNVTYVDQGSSFKLRYWKDFVVIELTDNDGNAAQYVKPVKIGELDFLK